jgi:hypothetical protein
MPDQDIWAVKVGPLVVGEVTERKPEPAWIKPLAWFLAVLLVAISVSPLLGVVVIIGAAILVAARTAPADSEKETHP